MGLSEVALNVSSELEDVGSAFGSANQTYQVNGIMGHMGFTGGSSFYDRTDFCDRTGDIVPSTNNLGEQFN